MSKINVIDIFCGAGGLSYGFFHNENFNILCANDIEKHMCDTYAANHKEVPVFNLDIKDFNLSLLSKKIGVTKNDVDIIIGGPPCQAYSTVGKRLLDDPRGKLFQEFYRLVQESDPQLFLFENVKGLISMDRGNLLKLIIKLFEELDYKVEYRVLNAADYGVPQNRERVVIVGYKKHLSFRFPEPTHANTETLVSYQKHLTLSDAISDLPSLENAGESVLYDKEPLTKYQKMMREKANILLDHKSPKNNEKMIKLMKALPDGGTPMDIDHSLRPTSGFKNTYCRLWWDKPATTITRNFGTPSSSRCIHPKDPRPLTIREAARIQSFPDHYIFCGPKTSKTIQIGNAVPPILSIKLVDSVLNSLKN